MILQSIPDVENTFGMDFSVPGWKKGMPGRSRGMIVIESLWWRVISPAASAVNGKRFKSIYSRYRSWPCHSLMKERKWWKSALDEKQLLLSGEVEMPDTLSYFSSDCCPLRNISLFMKNRIPLPLVFCFCISGLFQAVEADMPGKNMELYQSWRCPASPAFLFACKNKY